MGAHLCAHFPCLCTAVVIDVRPVRIVGDGVSGQGMMWKGKSCTLPVC